MSQTRQHTGTRLTLTLWHPDCWAIESTEKTGGGVLGHAVYSSPKTTDTEINGLFTAYGESTAQVEALLETIKESPHAGQVHELQERFGKQSSTSVPGNVAREFFVEYNPQDMVCPTLLKYGFVHSAPVRIEDGREYWQVVFAGERSEIESQLDGVRDEAGAEVTVSRISTSPPAEPERKRRVETLTSSQREVFDLARKRGYYQWPRGVSTRELAAELDVSKTTLLEHLRKAEAKLLDP
ncbi:helix-turn-helix domain-containing protein [Haladaptatus sp. DYSN1]|uniref:helix-turn-helix domain-containing protein n=1 Tax=unclassified Haladaptatus TaxID=2622732 RepID=UPI0024074D23|nr:helix-turn-helix domain-containing protein [Haladaptatus sp. DYSN1]